MESIEESEVEAVERALWRSWEGLSPSREICGNGASAEVVHVVVDNSNVFLGAQHVGSRRDPRVRVRVEALAAFLERGRPVQTRVVCGSRPPSTAVVWSRWERSRYVVRLGLRDRGKEVFVDDALHAELGRILNSALLCSDVDPSATTIVMVTGDGNKNGGRNNFPDCLAACATLGFRVEIVSWRRSLSRALQRLCDHPSGRVRVIYLDDVRERVTFVAKTPLPPRVEAAK